MTTVAVDGVPGLDLGELEPGIVELVISRPERRNALTEEMMQALERIGRELSADQGVRAVVLRGAGGTFCAGADREVVAARSAAQAPFRRPGVMGREAELLAAFEMPVVAVVTGAAVGLGMGLALASDVCVAEEGAFFAEAHLALGLCPTAMTWWLPRMCGLARATEIVLTGRRVTAEEAGRIGIVARHVPAGAGPDAGLEIARAIAAMPPVMARHAKLAMQIAQDQDAMARVRQFGGSANTIGKLTRDVA